MKSNRGFSLLETLLYLAIFAIVGGSLFGILTNVVRVSTREVSGDEVATQLQFAMQTINRLVKDSSNIEIATSTATTTLKLRMPVTAQDPTCIILSGGKLKLAQGADPFNKQNCTATTTDITTDKVVVDSARFKRLEFPGGHDQVLVDMQFSNLATGASKISRVLRSGISRASAATFDSDLLPNANGVYEVGFATPVDKRWKNLSASNLVYFGKLAADPGTSGNTGSIYYNTTSNTFRGNNNGTWNDLGSSLWMATSTNSMYANVSGNVGIGTNSPVNLLHLYATSGIKASTLQSGAYGYTTYVDSTDGSPAVYWTAGKSLRFGISTNGITNVGFSEKVRIDNNGNVGIGTTAPSSFVDIGGALSLAEVGKELRFSNASVQTSLRIGQGNSNHGWLSWVYNATPGNARFDLSTYNGSNPLTLQTSGGNVGIGTTAPNAKLHIVGTTQSNVFRAGISDVNSLTIGQSGGGYSDIGYNVNYTAITNQWKYSGTDQASLIDFYNGGFKFWGSPTVGVAGNITDMTPLMVISSSGNVGIGTTAPAYKLESKGNIVNSNPSNGWLGLTGDLPGYAPDIYPTLKTNGNYIYFSAGGLYSAYMSAGGVWTANSDKNKKENFVPLNSQEILEKIGKLPIVQWNYKSENAGIRHIGPFAQDFYQAFHLNGDNDKMISTIDPSGVALVGIQGLLERSKEQQQQIDELKAEVAKLKR